MHPVMPRPGRDYCQAWCVAIPNFQLNAILWTKDVRVYAGGIHAMLPRPDHLGPSFCMAGGGTDFHCTLTGRAWGHRGVRPRARGTASPHAEVDERYPAHSRIRLGDCVPVDARNMRAFPCNRLVRQSHDYLPKK